MPSYDGFRKGMQGKVDTVSDSSASGETSAQNPEERLTKRDVEQMSERDQLLAAAALIRAEGWNGINHLSGKGLCLLQALRKVQGCEHWSSVVVPPTLMQTAAAEPDEYYFLDYERVYVWNDSHCKDIDEACDALIRAANLAS